MDDRMVVEEFTRKLERKNKVVGKTNNNVRIAAQVRQEI